MSSMIERLFLVASDISVKSLPHAQANGGAVKTIISIVIVTTGAISLLFITIGGFRYVVSQGDPQDTARAKSTILFALVGLLIAITAQLIVTFVIGNIR